MLCYTRLMRTAMPAHRLTTSIRPVTCVARLPARVLLALIAVALLALPVLCIVHCRLAMQPVYHSVPSQRDPKAFFLCDLPLPTAASTLVTPAFLPGALPQLAAFGVALVLLRSLHLVAPAPLRPLHTPPPTPPPQ